MCVHAPADVEDRRRILARRVWGLRMSGNAAANNAADRHGNRHKAVADPKHCHIADSDVVSSA